MEPTAVKKKVHFQCRLFAKLQHNDSLIQTENKSPHPTPSLCHFNRWRKRYWNLQQSCEKSGQSSSSYLFIQHRKKKKENKNYQCCLGLVGFEFAPLLIYSYKQNISKRFVFFMASRPLRAINSHQGSIVAKAALCFLENLIACEAKQQLPNIYHRHVTRVIISP